MHRAAAAWLQRSGALGAAIAAAAAHNSPAQLPATAAAAAQRQQAAGFRSLFRLRIPRSTYHQPHHYPPKRHPGTHKHRGPLRRALGALGTAVGLAAVALPLGGVGAFVISGMEDADATELLLAVPRSLRAVWWGTAAAWRYKALAARHPDRKSEAYLQQLSLLHDKMSQGLLLLCQQNGGVYIKAGQLAVSLRAVPAEYRRALESLQDKVPPRPFDDINAVLLHDLGAPADKLFAAFDPLATAAASLAQVHRAMLHDGTAVAVKVQYPGLEGAAVADVAGMVAMARAGAWLFPDVDLVWMFEELRRKLQQELDFRIEGRNAARLAACMAGRRDVAVPRLVPELSGRRVLCMEWIDGCKVSDEERLQAAGLEPHDVGTLLLEAFADMTFVHGFVHGDPHPGNILVRADWGSQGWLSWLAFGRRPSPQLVLLDHGLYIQLPQDMRLQYCQLWCSFLLQDKDTAVQAATALGGEKAGRILPEVLRPRDWRQVSREERRKMRREAGLNSFADLGEILQKAPRELLDALRISAIVRHTAAQLGATIADRLRINATAAFNGLELQEQQQGPGPLPEAPLAPEAGASGGSLQERVRDWWQRVRGEEEEDAPAPLLELPPPASAVAPASAGSIEYFGVLRSRRKRWQLQARLWVMQGAFWLASLLQVLLDRVLPGAALLA